MQQTMQALQNELDSLRADNIKLYEKIKFLQSYPGRVCLRDSQNKPSLGVSVADECLIWIGLPSLLCFLPAAGWRQRRHRDALLLPVRGKTGSVCFLQQEGESHTLEIK